MEHAEHLRLAPRVEPFEHHVPADLPRRSGGGQGALDRRLGGLAGALAMAQRRSGEPVQPLEDLEVDHERLVGDAAIAGPAPRVGVRPAAQDLLVLIQ